MPKLTKNIVERAETKDKPYFLFDNTLTGFCVRVSPNAKRHYYVQYMKNKKVKRASIGKHGIYTTEKARDEAVIMLGEIKAGADPQQTKSDKRKEPLVEDLAERYMEEHVEQHCKLSTTKSYRRYLDKRILPHLGNIKVSEVQRSDIANFHHSLRSTPYEANRCLEVISKMFNLAELWGLRDDNSNPRRHIKKFPMKARERYLSKEEVKRLGEVIEETKLYPDENLSAVYCIQLLLLTGCRLGEIQTLKWEYIDHEKQVLNLPDSKTGAKPVYVGKTVMSVLNELYKHPARPKDNPYVIWGQNDGQHLNNIQKPWRRFRERANLQDVRIHDLRHSFASFAVSDGMSLAMIGKLLGHSQVQTTARYAHLMSDAMTEAASGVTDVLGELMNVSVEDEEGDGDIKQSEPPENVISGTVLEKPVYLTSDQAAEYLNVNQRLMENWRWRKCGPKFAKVGNRIRYNLEDLKEFVAG